MSRRKGRPTTKRGRRWRTNALRTVYIACLERPRKSRDVCHCTLYRSVLSLRHPFKHSHCDCRDSEDRRHPSENLVHFRTHHQLLVLGGAHTSVHCLSRQMSFRQAVFQLGGRGCSNPLLRAPLVRRWTSQVVGISPHFPLRACPPVVPVVKTEQKGTHLSRGDEGICR